MRWLVRVEPILISFSIDRLFPPPTPALNRARAFHATRARSAIGVEGTGVAGAVRSAANLLPLVANVYATFMDQLLDLP